MKWLAYITIVIVTLTIVATLFLVGSPTQARLERLDERRENDLQRIYSAIASYYADNEALPDDLYQLYAKGQVTDRFVDPETGSNYEYIVKTPIAFELCAQFALASDSNLSDAYAPVVPSSAYDYYFQDWQEHDAGRYCFDLIVPTKKDTNDIIEPRPVNY